MSERYPGALITKTPVTPAGPAQDGAAPGVWTLDQQMQYQKQGVWPTQGTLGPDAYIENLFSTYLYTGNGSTQTITNGIDLSGKGGLTLIKMRNTDASYGDYPFSWFDTVRGATKALYSNGTAVQSTYPTSLTAFTSSGFSLGTQIPQNGSNDIFASWTFRKQAKFFDIVTYTGTGSNTTIAHNLGSTPGCIIVKRTDTAGNWQVYHSGLTSAAYSIQLNLTSAQASATTVWNSTAPTSSVFSVGTDASVNASGGTYVAYIYASNAGGFGAAGTDNVISCGSYTGNGSATGPTVTLGYEPQWVLIKSSSNTYGWFINDIMRGMSVSDTLYLQPNVLDAEQDAGVPLITPRATGFQLTNAAAAFNGSGSTYIYIAIRRGPMKTPTDATKVFNPMLRTGTGAGAVVTGVGFPPDLALIDTRSNIGGSAIFTDRLRGTQKQLQSALTNAESTPAANGGVFVLGQDGVSIGPDYDPYTNVLSYTYIDWMLRRAPGFFDEVCYTGTSPGSGSYAINHNLGVAPELIIYRQRNGASNWQAGTNFTSTNWRSMFLNIANAGSQTTYATNDWFSAQPTSTTFTVGWPYYTTGTWVAYLFASCPGVSKVGTYSGTGATQTINCGFTGGARFVLIKRTDSTGDWYVWDTARGMVSGTDPSLLINSTAAEVNANSVYTATTGFQIVSTAAGINASGGSYIFLAIA